MKTLTSRQNPLYRQWLAQQKRNVRHSEMIALEGSHLCISWLAHRGLPRYALFAQESLDQPEIVDVLAQVEHNTNVIAMPVDLIGGLSSLVTAPPVIFMVDTPSEPEPPTIEANCVLLDEVQDPGNVGTILRTAAAAGITQVFTSSGTAACWSPKVLRAGQGAQFALEMHESVDLLNIIQANRTKPAPLPLMVTSLAPQSQDLFQTRLPANAIWVFGHEGVGVSPAIAALADQVIHIAQAPGAVQSLNVASAAAICLFEQRRQQQASSNQ